MDLSVRRSAPHLLHALGIVALVISAALGATACAGVMTTGSLVKNAKASITEQSGVHLVTIAKSSSSSSTEKIIADFGTKSGVENISEGKADSVIKVMPTYAYISGNSSGLTTIFGLSSADHEQDRQGLGVLEGRYEPVLRFQVRQHYLFDHGCGLEGRGCQAVYRCHQGCQAVRPNVDDRGYELFAEGFEHPHRLGPDEPAGRRDRKHLGGAKETTTFSKWDEHVVVNVPPVASTITASGL